MEWTIASQPSGVPNPNFLDAMASRPFANEAPAIHERMEPRMWPSAMVPTTNCFFELIKSVVFDSFCGTFCELINAVMEKNPTRDVL